MSPFQEKASVAVLLGLFVVSCVLLARVFIVPKSPSRQRSALSPPLRDAGPPSTVETFDVDRAVANDLLARRDELARPLHFVPEQDMGRIVGIGIFGVHPDDPFTQLGLKNGDRLETINGRDVMSLEQPSELLAVLRADHIALRVKRREAEIELDYTIR